MNIEDLERFDPQKMYQTYDNWPIYSESAFRKECSKIQLQDIDHVVLAGMWGSGAIGDVISAIINGGFSYEISILPIFNVFPSFSP